LKYTRYDLKRGKDNRTFITIILFILILAFVLGTIIFRLFIKNPIGSNVDSGNVTQISDNKDKNKPSNSTTNSQAIRFIAVQGGIYKSKENADSEKTLLSQYGTPFTVNEEDKTRVFLGIYAEDQGEKIMKSLTDQKVDNSKMLFTMNNNELCDVEISEIISANIQILNKLAEKNVKAIQTEELKKWCSALKKVDKDSKNILVLNDMQDHINKMPKELTKENVGENYSYIYNILKKVSLK
jgi:hypothetical protein